MSMESSSKKLTVSRQWRLWAVAALGGMGCGLLLRTLPLAGAFTGTVAELRPESAESNALLPGDAASAQNSSVPASLLCSVTGPSPTGAPNDTDLTTMLATARGWGGSDPSEHQPGDDQDRAADIPSAPEDFREMANIADWERAAALIAQLPEEERKSPGTRYVLAVAQRETGSCREALVALEGLEKDLPLLVSEIRELRARCQLEVGPFDRAVAYFEALDTPEGLIEAAQARFNAGQYDDAFWTVHRALRQVARQGGNRTRRERNEARGRHLRAQIALQRSQPLIAAKDFRWLATEAATIPISEGADTQYERLSGKPLSKEDRIRRAAELANQGRIDAVENELAELERAPGKDPPELDKAAARAWAYYHSRAHYAKAAALFHEAASLSEEERPRFLFYAAKSHSRSHDDYKAIAEYRALAEQFPGSGYVERALFRVPRLYYGRARFEEAEAHYLKYLERFPYGQYVSSAKYDLAISRLAGKRNLPLAYEQLGRLAQREGSRDQAALLRHLQGVALQYQQGDEARRKAVAQFQQVIADYPVSFAALASAARLEELGRPNTLRGRLATSLDAKREGRPAVAGIELPAKAKLLAELGLHTDAERVLFEQRRELRRQYSDKKWQALCQLYGALDRGYRRYSLAYTLMARRQLREAPEPDNLWAWECAYPQPYQAIVNEVEQRYGLPQSLVHAVMRQESGFRPNVVSPVGAVGLMQLMPRTAQLAAQEITQLPDIPHAPDPTRPTNVRNNVELGGFYLSKLLGMLQDQMPLAIAAYNAGPSAVSRWLNGGDRLPVDVWVARIPYRETRHYVARVMGNWLTYRYLSNPRELPRLELALIEGTRPDPEAY